MPKSVIHNFVLIDSHFAIELPESFQKYFPKFYRLWNIIHSFRFSFRTVNRNYDYALWKNMNLYTCLYAELVNFILWPCLCSRVLLWEWKLRFVNIFSFLSGFTHIWSWHLRLLRDQQLGKTMLKSSQTVIPICCQQWGRQRNPLNRTITNLVWQCRGAIYLAQGNYLGCSARLSEENRTGIHALNRHLTAVLTALLSGHLLICALQLIVSLASDWWCRRLTNQGTKNRRALPVPRGATAMPQRAIIMERWRPTTAPYPVIAVDRPSALDQRKRAFFQPLLVASTTGIHMHSR